MKPELKKYITILLCMIILITAVTPVNGVSDVPLKEKYTYGSSQESSSEYYKTQEYPCYSSVLEEYEKKGYKPALGHDVVLKPEVIRLPDSGKVKTQTNIGGKTDSAFIWNEDNASVEWEFTTASEGLYEVEIEYYMLPGSGNPAVRSLEVDGSVPFLEANSMNFYRLWRDKGEPGINSLRDETRPNQVEIQEWQSKKLTDSEGLYAEPFRFYFKAGKHVIRMTYVDQSMAVGKLTIKHAEEIPSYDAVKKSYIGKGYANATKTVEFQAESTAEKKSVPTIRREYNADPSCEPSSNKNRVLNVIGGSRWKSGNQSIQWNFSVPEDGIYKVGIRVLQTWNDGLPSYRQIAIDGKVPFKEMLEYQFKYSLKWQTEVLGDKNNEPYLFYLTKGEHTLTMTVKMGDFTPVLQSLNDDTILLSNMVREIIKVTGSEPDPNYDYDLMNTVPNLKSDMETLINSLQKKYDITKNISDKLPSMANNFMTIKSQLKSMVKDPFSIARRMDDLNSAQTNLGTWYTSLKNQPLLIDYFLVGAPGEKMKNKQSNILQKIWSTIESFLVSFTKDYDNVGSVVKDDVKVKTVINVWVARGTEWAELIKEMADEEFTPQTGIMVNINVLPASQLHAGNVNTLMLSLTSGKAPDVALGTDSTSPVEFAIRDSVLDLSKFKDFDEVSKRFMSNIFTPYKYRGGVYALPETMDFSVMFYRKDIIKELGIKLPETRGDLYNQVLPVLYQNGLEFYYPADFHQFIFQHGASYYTSDGLKSGLDTPEAFQAVKECTELYTNYGVPVAANFFNRMRSGEMPIGIGGYSLYMQLSVAAPELAGRWGIAPLPGIRKQDGTIDRSNGGLAGQCSIIMKQTKHPEESWEFLKWWSSTSVQTKFAREVEALVGAEARWNTANVEAFTNLGWDRKDLKVIQEQWKWAKETPVVLGGYFTGRHITNAWNSIVVSSTPVRDALEKAVKDINRELRMKQEEYGVNGSQ